MLQSERHVNTAMCMNWINESLFNVAISYDAFQSLWISIAQTQLHSICLIGNFRKGSFGWIGKMGCGRNKVGTSALNNIMTQESKVRIGQRPRYDNRHNGSQHLRCYANAQSMSSYFAASVLRSLIHRVTDVMCRNGKSVMKISSDSFSNCKYKLWINLKGLQDMSNMSLVAGQTNSAWYVGSL